MFLQISTFSVMGSGFGENRCEVQLCAIKNISFIIQGHKLFRKNIQLSFQTKSLFWLCSSSACTHLTKLKLGPDLLLLFVIIIFQNESVCTLKLKWKPHTQCHTKESDRLKMRRSYIVIVKLHYTEFLRIVMQDSHCMRVLCHFHMICLLSSWTLGERSTVFLPSSLTFTYPIGG